MIQLIVNTEVNLKDILEQEIDGVRLFNFSFHTIPEMSGQSYLLLINEPDDFDSIEIAIEAIGDIEVIGSYNEDGSQYVYGNPNRNHTIQKYKGSLRNKVTYDDNGDVLTDEPYTEEEAKSVQALKVFGYPDRDLNS